MNEFNERTSLNHRLQQAQAETFLNRCEARRRQSARRINKVFRQCVTTAAVDGVVIGASLTACVVALLCVII